MPLEKVAVDFGLAVLYLYLIALGLLIVSIILGLIGVFWK